MTSRRDFIAALPAFGTALGMGKPQTAVRPTIGSSATNRIPLEHDWKFRLDPAASRDPHVALSGSANWQSVNVPHTWQTLGNSPDYVGVAWYRLAFDAPSEWRNQFVRLEFEAVYHSADVFLNGASIGEHVGKGYTAFTCDASPRLKSAKQTNCWCASTTVIQTLCCLASSLSIGLTTEALSGRYPSGSRRMSLWSGWR